MGNIYNATANPETQNWSYREHRSCSPPPAFIVSHLFPSCPQCLRVTASPNQTLRWPSWCLLTVLYSLPTLRLMTCSKQQTMMSTPHRTNRTTGGCTATRMYLERLSLPGCWSQQPCWENLQSQGMGKTFKNHRSLLGAMGTWQSWTNKQLRMKGLKEYCQHFE